MKSLLLAIFCSIALAQDSITPASLRGIVSFLASDALQGRDTPSAGLDAAAAYIASAFRGDALESPIGDEYSQYADFVQVSGNDESLQFSLSGTPVPSTRIAVESLEGAQLANEPVFKWTPDMKIDGLLNGKLVMLRSPDRTIIAKLEREHPDAIVQLTEDIPAGGWPKGLELSQGPGPAMISVPASDVESIFDRLPAGDTGARAELNIGAPSVRPVRLRNVIGVLRGSDPRLREEYVLVSAHYDHLGVSEAGVFNGANDNASGVAAVLSLAAAFSRDLPPPKRTLIFVAFSGEEKGLLGSTWYANHPIVPLARTIANFNFEQLGESAKDGGVPTAALGMTGYGLSDLPRLLTPALASAGVALKDASGNLNYFGRSDNYPLAKAGIPSHTFVAAFEFPDYHQVTDRWQKLNYDNMATITRALAVAIKSLADGPEVPHWIESPKTKSYLDAWRAMHP